MSTQSITDGITMIALNFLLWKKVSQLVLSEVIVHIGQLCGASAFERHLVFFYLA